MVDLKRKIWMELNRRRKNKISHFENNLERQLMSKE
jgi:hypothetical protein